MSASSGVEIVEVELLVEDWAVIRRALQAPGRDPEGGLSWLLELGLDRYVRDEAEWKALDGQPDAAAQARRQELKRRETQAHLVSMRASTIAAEKVMHELGERVHVLGAELHANRRTMRPLREENALLEAHLKAMNGSANDASSGPAARPTFLKWLRGFLWSRRDGHD